MPSNIHLDTENIIEISMEASNDSQTDPQTRVICVTTGERNVGILSHIDNQVVDGLSTNALVALLCSPNVKLSLNSVTSSDVVDEEGKNDKENDLEPLSVEAAQLKSTNEWPSLSKRVKLKFVRVPNGHLGLKLAISDSSSSHQGLKVMDSERNKLTTSGILNPGDVILTVNGIILAGLSPEDTSSIFKNAENRLLIVLENPGERDRENEGMVTEWQNIKKRYISRMNESMDRRLTRATRRAMNNERQLYSMRFTKPVEASRVYRGQEKDGSYDSISKRLRKRAIVRDLRIYTL